MTGAADIYREGLRAYGYATRAHADGGYMRPRWGFGRGFDRYQGTTRRGARRIFKEPENWIRSHRDQSFFLFLHTYDAHSRGRGPRYTAKGRFKSHWSAKHRTPQTARIVGMMLPQTIATDDDIAYVRATYAESVRQLDTDLADLFRFLRTAGVWNDALIVLWSDHGEGLFDHGSFSHDQLYEHTVRSVLMIKLPGDVRGGRIRAVVREIDLLPTILELVGAPPANAIDGMSFAGLMRDEPSEERQAFSKLTRSGKRQFSVRSKTHRYIWNESSNTALFFDLVADPGETSNLSPSNDPLEAELREALLAWVNDYDATFAEADGGDTRMPLDTETHDALRALGYLE